MPEEGKTLVCRFCQQEAEAVASESRPACQKCYDKYSLKVIDQPLPWYLFDDAESKEQATDDVLENQQCDLRDLYDAIDGEDTDPDDEAGPSTTQGQQELSQSNLSQHLDQIERANARRLYVEHSKSYRRMLKEQQWDHGRSREEALLYVKNNITWSTMLPLVIACEEGDHRERLRLRDDCHRVLRERRQHTREANLAYLRRDHESHPSFQSVADSEDEEYQNGVSSASTNI